MKNTLSYPTADSLVMAEKIKYSLLWNSHDYSGTVGHSKVFEC